MHAITKAETLERHLILAELGRERSVRSHRAKVLPAPRKIAAHEFNQIAYVPPVGQITRTLFGDRIIR